MLFKVLHIDPIFVDQDIIVVPLRLIIFDEAICQQMIDIDGDDYMTQLFVAEIAFDYEHVGVKGFAVVYESCMGPIPIPFDALDKETLINIAYKSPEVQDFIMDEDERRRGRTNYDEDDGFTMPW